MLATPVNDVFCEVYEVLYTYWRGLFFATTIAW
jgi:hypothetical protein